MKGIPKVFNTREDIFNCLAMVHAGEINKEEFKTVIRQLQTAPYLQVPILKNEGKKITVRYCYEAAAGFTTGNGAKITDIQHVFYGDTSVVETDAAETPETETKAEADNKDKTPDETIIILSRAIPQNETIILIPDNTNWLDTLGITQDDLTHILGVLKNE